MHNDNDDDGDNNNNNNNDTIYEMKRSRNAVVSALSLPRSCFDPPARPLRTHDARDR